MGILNSLFKSKKSANELECRNVDKEPSKAVKYVVDNTKNFLGLCHKIAVGGKGRMSFPVYIELRTTQTGLLEVFGVHTVHDDDLLEFAYDSAHKNDRSMVEYYYNAMINEYGLSQSELRSFQDVSDFMDFLQGGISGYNACKRSGSDIEITQKLGTAQREERENIFLAMKEECLKTYAWAQTRYYGSDTMEIKL